VISLLALSVHAQQVSAPVAPTGNSGTAASTDSHLYIAGSTIAELIAKSEAATKSGVRLPSGAMLASGPYRADMLYRATPQDNSDVHPTDAELFVVIEGSGAMLMGGKLINPTPRGASFTSPTTEGGTEYRLNKGDMILVPENTPHRISAVTGANLVVMTVHLAHPAPAPVPAAPSAQAGK
jgi:mannose-6-phosphate isomerase-like protein (cupin superfamily)